MSLAIRDSGPPFASRIALERFYTSPVIAPDYATRPSVVAAKTTTALRTGTTRR
jgi:hypothetical protein